MNPDQTIVVIGGRIKLVQNKQINDHMSAELLRNFNFLTWFMFKLDVYDMENDSLDIWTAFKVIFDATIISILLKHFSLNLQFKKGNDILLRNTHGVLRSCQHDFLLVQLFSGAVTGS